MKRIAAVTGLVLAVTVGGVMAGALLVSPLAAANRWVLPGVAVVAIGAAVAMLTVRLAPAVRGAMVRLGRGPVSAARRVTAGAPRTSRATPAFARPGFSLGGRVDRTPKGVHALAATGATLVEIARRTRLPVDAVSLVLSISAASRQLQPPTA